VSEWHAIHPEGSTYAEAHEWLLQHGVLAKLSTTLQPVLTELWSEGYTRGLSLSGKRIAAITTTLRIAAVMGGWLTQIVRTTLKLIATALANRTPLNLADPARAETIAITEVNRAISQATADSFHEDGVLQIRWVTGGPDPCELCLANEAQGPHPFGVPFISGALVPPQHPNCRCHIEKAE
jgi:hypothetical protein